MQETASYDEAKAELQAILNSGCFAHAPSLAQFLSYVCAKAFEGEAQQIKEYSIAVEALGRPSGFDQKKDSIVRVEAHRLRKRLRQYYLTDGACHNLQIVIPPGQYAPQFVPADAGLGPLSDPLEAGVEDGEEVEPANGVCELALTSPDPVAVARRGPPVLVLSLAAIAVVLSVIFVTWRFTPLSHLLPREAKANARESPVTAGNSGEIRILTGRSAGKYVDRFGNTWEGDRFFNGGAVFSTPPGYHVRGTEDPVIFQARREGTFSYDIPLSPGAYELHLYFAETLFGEGNIAGGGETYRIFDILANGKPLSSNFDVVADAPGPNTADEKVYKDITPAADGYLHLAFPPATREIAFLNAIEILPGTPGKLRPIRIVARDTSLTSKDGRLWGADRYFIGGQRVQRPEVFKGTTDPDLYTGERFGNFTYSIPAAPGRYTVTLRFCESWFGPNKPAGGGAGSRIFDVYMNGLALLRGFDIFKEAGGGDRPLDKVFHSLTPNAQGKLTFSFVPVHNYACLNAIEVVDEGSRD